MRLLLDEHLSPHLAVRLQKETSIDAVSLHAWWDGALLGSADHTLLMLAFEDRRTLLTYDLRTIPQLLRELMEAAKDHAGVIFVDERTIPSNQLTRLVKSLKSLNQEMKNQDFLNRAVWLSKGL